MGTTILSFSDRIVIETLRHEKRLIELFMCNAKAGNLKTHREEVSSFENLCSYFPRA